MTPNEAITTIKDNLEKFCNQDIPEECLNALITLHNATQWTPYPEEKPKEQIFYLCKFMMNGICPYYDVVEYNMGWIHHNKNDITHFKKIYP